MFQNLILEFGISNIVHISLMILQIVNTTIVPKQRLRHTLPQEQNSHQYDNIGKTNDEARLHWVKQIGSLSCQRSSSS